MNNPELFALGIVAGLVIGFIAGFTLAWHAGNWSRNFSKDEEIK